MAYLEGIFSTIRKLLLEYKQHIKETIKLALPVSIAHLGHIMIGVVDSIMIGNLGASYLAASALVNILLFLVIVIGMGVTIAITPLTAIANGSGNHEECGIILRQGLLVNLIFALFLFAIPYFGADLIVYLDQPEDVVALSISYLKILSFSILPFIIFQVFRQFIEGLGNTKPAMYISIISVFINAAGNWLLIYGNFGFPKLELDGAGLASLATRIFIALSMAVYVVKSPRYKRYDASLRFRNINLRVMKKVINIGLPTGLQMFFEIGAFALAAIIIGWMGTNFLAAHQIALNLSSITFMLVLGISSAATIRIGDYYGRKDYNELKKAANTALLSAVSIMGVFGLTFIFTRNLLPTLYISEAEVISLTADLLIFAAIFQIFDGSQIVGLGILRGMTDVRTPMIVTFIAYWIIAIPFGYYLGIELELNANGIWISITLALILIAMFFIFRIRRNISDLIKNNN